MTVSNLIGSFRKKDDQYNWFAGGVSSGSVLGAYYRSYRVGFVTATLLGLGLLGLKVAHLNNYKLLDDNYVCGEGGATAHKYDFTLTKERPRNWIAGN